MVRFQWASIDTSLYSIEPFSGAFEFIAVDPISYYINSGDASGEAYEGKIGGKDGVIHQVIDKYVTDDLKHLGLNLEIRVGDTDDQSNIYHQMRMDPKTFISSMLDWSSSFTKNKTHWIVANGQDDEDPNKLKIQIEESSVPDLGWPKNITDDNNVVDNKPMVLRYGGPEQNPMSDVFRWEFLADGFISALSTKMVTSGMSAVSGEYLDRIIDEETELSVFVKDDNTENKVNPNINSEQGFSRPKKQKRGWTHIRSIPEHNAGDVGIKYNEYLDGRARHSYLSMLNMLMRLRVTVRGQPRLFESSELGRVKIRMKWLKLEPDGDSQTRFLDGDWILYGWHHKLKPDGSWVTDVYLSRLDWDAAAKPGNLGAGDAIPAISDLA